LLLCVTWYILFSRFESIRGWALGDVLALYGVAAGGFGLSVVLFGGVGDLGQKIHSGGLDALLTQPKSALLQAVCARSVASGWGDIASGLVLVGLSGHLRLDSVMLVPLSMALGSIVLVSTGVILQSSVFWLGRVDSLAQQAAHFLMLFSTYPPSIFGGALKLLLFTIVPAGFVSYLPVELLRKFNWLDLVSCVAAAGIWSALAAWVFARGLQHYESGNRFVVRV
ncbi:MAG: ABC-2 family transporter protein, partial [Myxococcales bacterium]|nr:ABC-2 family transporter protein [Myxococcales bacterium]